MKEISEKLRKKAIAGSKPLIEQLVGEGLDQNRIVQTIKQQVQAKINVYYAKQKQPEQVAVSLKKALDRLCGIKADSKAETVFYNMLCESQIKFNFQYPIGPYTADYLISDFLVVELDGPQHVKERDERRDKYLRNMGYKVLRVPIWVLAHEPEAVLNEIKQGTRRLNRHEKQSRI